MQSSKGWIGLALSMSLLAGGWPAEASEVVKLARLVVSGKRAANEAPRAQSTPQEPRSPANTQAQGSGGGSDEAGNAPTPSRNVS
jgi:hypothetical protein